MFYVFLYCVILIWLIVGSEKKVSNKVYICVPLFIMCLTIGLRYQTGRDLENYYLLFTRAVNRRSELYYDAEKSYILISQVLGYFGFEFQALVLLYAVCSFVFIYKGLVALQLEKNEVAIFVSLFFALGYSTYFVIMRQFLAATLIFYAFTLNSYNRRYRCKELALLISATLIHRGAMALIPLYFIFKSKLFDRDITKVICILGAIVFGKSNIVFIILKELVKLFPQYSYYIQKENFGSGSVSKIVVLMTVIFIFTLFIERKYGYSGQDNSLIISKGICFCFCVYYATLPLGWFHRSYWYIYMFSFFIPIKLISIFTKKNALVFTTICLCLIYIICVYYRISITEPSMVPYRFSLKII